MGVEDPSVHWVKIASGDQNDGDKCIKLLRGKRAIEVSKGPRGQTTG